ncbi:hypothetical protein [Kitasatospora griseola]
MTWIPITTAHRPDGQLRLTAVSNPVGDRWTCRHDPTGGVIEETDFAGLAVRYERDLTGVLTARTNAAGQRVEYGRDARDRTVEMHADDLVTRYTYDGAGRVLTVGDGTPGLRRHYDQYCTQHAPCPVAVVRTED